MKLNFRNEEEFRDFICEFMINVFDYIEKDEGKFQNFCEAFYSVLYCRDFNELFEKYSAIIKRL